MHRSLGRAPTGSFVTFNSSTKDQSASVIARVVQCEGGLGASSYKIIVGALPKRAIFVIQMRRNNARKDLLDRSGALLARSRLPGHLPCVQ